MSLDCPNCGTHLTVHVAGGTTTPSPAATAGNEPVVPPGPKKRASPRANPIVPTVAELRRLAQFLRYPFPSASTCKPAQPTLGPVIVSPGPADDDCMADELGLPTDPRPRKTLILAALRMYFTMRTFGGEHETADTLLEARQGGHKALEAVGAIIYAMEWTGRGVDPPEVIPWPPEGAGLLGPLDPGRVLYPPSCGIWNNYRSRIRRLFEMMLVVDYGFPARPTCPLEASFLHGWAALESFADSLIGTAQAWRWRQQLPTGKHWAMMVYAASSWDHGMRGLNVPVWDIATMLFYYRLHREPGDVADHKQRWIGYTGVLQEMIAEAPTRGTDRLQRKLSLDAYTLIPRFVRDRELRTQMLLAIRDIAAKHGCQLAPPQTPKPSTWQRLFGRVSFHRGPRGGEKCSEDRKQIINLSWESGGESETASSCWKESCLG